MLKKVLYNFKKFFKKYDNIVNYFNEDKKTKDKGDIIMSKEGFYNALDVAQYVINYAIEQGKPVSNLKLQKILYYIQAAFLVEKGVPCFKEQILNWRHGPVVKEVYDEYKDYANNEISDIQKGYYKLLLDKNNLKFVTKFEEFEQSKISEEDKKLINKVIDSYLNIDAWELVRRTHLEDPWGKESERNGNISTDSIKNYFKTNKNKIYGG